MPKIKIIEKEIEIEGTIEKGNVKPFGTSSHIPFTKKHLGKVVKVVVPIKPKYVWLISKEEKNKLLKYAKKNIEKENGKLKHYRLQSLRDLEKTEFDLDSLVKVLDFFHDKELIKKINSLYGL